MEPAAVRARHRGVLHDRHGGIGPAERHLREIGDGLQHLVEGRIGDHVAAFHGRLGAVGERIEGGRGVGRRLPQLRLGVGRRQQRRRAGAAGQQAGGKNATQGETARHETSALREDTFEHLLKFLEHRRAREALGVNEEGGCGIHAEHVRTALADGDDVVEQLLIGDALVVALLREAGLLHDVEERGARIGAHERPVVLLGEHGRDQRQRLALACTAGGHRGDGGQVVEREFAHHEPDLARLDVLFLDLRQHLVVERRAVTAGHGGVLDHGDRRLLVPHRHLGEGTGLHEFGNGHLGRLGAALGEGRRGQPSRADGGGRCGAGCQHEGLTAGDERARRAGRVTHHGSIASFRSMRLRQGGTAHEATLFSRPNNIGSGPNKANRREGVWSRPSRPARPPISGIGPDRGAELFQRMLQRAGVGRGCGLGGGPALRLRGAFDRPLHDPDLGHGGVAEI